MEYLIIGLLAVIASSMTLFTGFGLSTVLLPIFTLYLPVEQAIIATAFVHLAHNVFKLLVFRNKVVLEIVISFGVPALFAAIIGAWSLQFFANLQQLTSFNVFGLTAVVTPLKLIVAGTMLGFACFEFKRLQLTKTRAFQYLPIGGIVAGYFGGFSGYQGAIRSLFLVKIISSPARFAGTSAGIGCLVDLVRVTIYLVLILVGDFKSAFSSQQIILVFVGCLGALVGVYGGRPFVYKLSGAGLKKLVILLLVGAAIALGTGLL